MLYNDTINKIKTEERQDCREPKPLTFSVKNANSKRGKTIRFEILGENAQIEILDGGEDKEQEAEEENELF